MESEVDRYVAELDIPAPVYMPAVQRKELGNPEYFGCLRAYWYVYFDTDSNGTKRPLGIRLTAEIEASGREEAEDKALNAGLRFAEVAAAYSGSPLWNPSLNRLGRVGASDGLLDQYNYYYLEGVEAYPRALLRPYDLERLLLWFSTSDQRTADRLSLAARWYGTSVGAEDPLDGYLSVWIGFESVGPTLGTRVHSFGPKASCKVCGNKAGIKRNNGEAGIEHAVKETAPELLDGRSLTDLKELRNQIAHGLSPASSLRPIVREFLPDLQLGLIFAILTVARPETSAPRSGRAILPRDFRPYPDARAMLRSAVELVNHRPFFGGWVQVKRRFIDSRSRVEADGNYVWGAKTGIETVAIIPNGAPALEKSYVIFERRGRSWEDQSESDLPSIPVVPWRATPISPAWRRYLSAQADDDNDAKSQ